MTFIPTIYGSIDNNNSTTSTLTANSVFTGASTLVTNYSNITTNITVDQPSITYGLQIQFSQDNSHWDIIRGYTIPVPTPGTSISQTITCPTESQYYRIVYTNGTTNQGVMRMQSILNANKNEVTTLAESNCWRIFATNISLK